MSESDSPYVGLRPFLEQDRAFFFGRERETRVISSNVIVEPLTVLYGPSGAGKSSVLQAGVIQHLRSLPNTVVVYFRNWQSNSFAEELRTKVVEAIAGSKHLPLAAQGEDLRDILARSNHQVLLLLDQFEEFLLYSPTDRSRADFEALLARLVNEEDTKTRILLGIREDALSKLNQRFAIRIPDLFGNTLVVERLTLPAARDAIVKPLEVFNCTPAAGGLVFRAEPALVSAILDQVREGHASTSDFVGIGSNRSAQPAAKVETAYLQLVLTRLWQQERAEGSIVLRVETLERMGGAGQIVRDHVHSVMQRLETDADRDIAARMFLHLVTPSQTKIAQRTEDLVFFAEAPASKVKEVLNALTDQPESRILRRVSNPEQYEIFHDVLAQHILEWRRGYESQKELARRKLEEEAESGRRQRELERVRELAETQRLRADEQAASARRLRVMLVALILLFAAAAGAAFYGFLEERRAQRNAAEAAAYAAEARSAQEREKANLQQLRATEAERDGNLDLATHLRQEAEDSRTRADAESEHARQQGTAAFSAAQELSKAKAERDSYASQMQSLQEQLKDAQEKIRLLQKAQEDSRSRLPNETNSKAQPKHEPIRPDTVNEADRSPGSKPNRMTSDGSPNAADLGSIRVNVTVLDNWNRVATGLEPGNFRLFEDDLEQRLTSVSSKDDPVSVAVVLNLGTLMPEAIPKIYEATVELMKTFAPEDEFLLVRPDNVLSPFSGDPNALTAALQTVNPSKRPSLCDALYLALNEMRKARHARKLVVIMSNTTADYSHHKHSEVVNLTRRIDAQIDSLAVYDPEDTVDTVEVPGTMGRIPSPEVRWTQEFLEKIAHETGGQSFALSRSKVSEISDDATKFGIDIRNQYTLQYLPTDRSHDGRYRHIRVELVPPKGLPHLNVLYRPGYLAPSQ